MAPHTLFVSNFPFTTTEDELRSSFQEFCDVTSVRIITDRQTGRSRGFAFIEVSEESGAEQAIEQLNESQFRGRRMVVNHAKGRAPGAERPRDAAPASQASEPFRHRIVVDWCEDQGHYLAEAPDLGLSAHADRIEDAIRELRALSRRSEHEKAQAAGA